MAPVRPRLPVPPTNPATPASPTRRVIPATPAPPATPLPTPRSTLTIGDLVKLGTSAAESSPKPLRTINLNELVKIGTDAAQALSPPQQTLVSAFERLADTAATLNKVSDALSAPIAALDASFKELNIGAETWVEVESGEDTEGDWEWQRSLGYAKVGGRWGIAIRDCAGPMNEPWTRCDDWLFSDAPRAFRVKAIDRLPLLVEALINAASLIAEELESKFAAAADVARAAQAVVQARKTKS